jgi:cytochrome b pre-mRNA-processing protein 3
MGIAAFLRRRRFDRQGTGLYSAAVRAARVPVFYATLAVPDTLDGRFDLIGVHVALIIRRLRREPEPGPALAQAVFDAMFQDMDVSLRELGVSDLSVGKRVKAMWDAFHGRAGAYEAAMATGDQAALADALARNVWRGAAPDGADACLAAHVLALAGHLAAQGADTLAGGQVTFLPAPPFSREAS